MGPQQSKQTEEWRLVIGYQGRYEVSNKGEIRRTKSRRVLAAFTHSERSVMQYVDLRGPDGKHRHSVAELVAEAFLPPAPADWLIGHRSDDVSDNSVGNLVWLSPAEHTALWSRRSGRRRSPTGEFIGGAHAE